MTTTASPKMKRPATVTSTSTGVANGAWRSSSTARSPAVRSIAVVNTPPAGSTRSLATVRGVVTMPGGRRQGEVTTASTPRRRQAGSVRSSELRTGWLTVAPPRTAPGSVADSNAVSPAERGRGTRRSLGPKRAATLGASDGPSPTTSPSSPTNSRSSAWVGVAESRSSRSVTVGIAIPNDSASTAIRAVATSATASPASAPRRQHITTPPNATAASTEVVDSASAVRIAPAACAASTHSTAPHPATRTTAIPMVTANRSGRRKTAPCSITSMACAAAMATPRISSTRACVISAPVPATTRDAQTNGPPTYATPTPRPMSVNGSRRSPGARSATSASIPATKPTVEIDSWADNDPIHG